MSLTQPQQVVLDFDEVADAIILVAVDGREVEVPRRGLVVVVGPDGRVRGRYALPESVFAGTPRAVPIPRHQAPYRGSVQ